LAPRESSEVYAHTIVPRLMVNALVAARRRGLVLFFDE